MNNTLYDGVIEKPDIDNMLKIRYGVVVHSAKGTSWFKKNAKYTKKEKKNGKWRYYYQQAKETIKKGVEKVKNIAQGIYQKVKNRRLKDIKVDDESMKNKIDSIKNRSKSDLAKPPKEVKRVKEYKYFKKIQMPNGKYRYFYSEKEYQAYLKRLERRDKALDKDYDFMENVPVLDVKMEPGKAAYHADLGTESGNCASCSLAFELLMRGYDVRSSKDVDGLSYKEWGIDCFEGFEEKAGTKYNWYLDTSKKENEKYTNRKTSEEEKLQIAKADLERTIIERGGNNQRGFMSVGWTYTDPDENGNRKAAGGAHLFNYVVTNGKVVFYDSQKGESNNQEGGRINIEDYLDNIDYTSHKEGSDGGWVTYCSLFRVDNKDLKPAIKDYISYKPEQRDYHFGPEEKWKMERRYG